MTSKRSATKPALDSGIMEALDMPEELRPLQDSYWKKRHEWEELEHAFLTVMQFCLDQRALRDEQP